jgi:hypothetical protein
MRREQCHFALLRCEREAIDGEHVGGAGYCDHIVLEFSWKGAGGRLGAGVGNCCEHTKEMVRMKA